MTDLTWLMACTDRGIAFSLKTSSEGFRLILGVPDIAMELTSDGYVIHEFLASSIHDVIMQARGKISMVPIHKPAVTSAPSEVWVICIHYDYGVWWDAGYFLEEKDVDEAVAELNNERADRSGDICAEEDVFYAQMLTPGWQPAEESK